MMTTMKSIAIVAGLGAALLMSSCASGPGGNKAVKAGVSAGELRGRSETALRKLYAHDSVARQLGRKAKGVLVFPEVVKGGLVAGGAYGNGTLFESGQVAGYYNTTMASYGLQLGLQKYSYALMLMDSGAMSALNRSGGWDIGSSPSIVVVDEGISGSLSTTTIQDGTYAFFFGQKGLMGGFSLEGSKITRIVPTYP
jgi:lipid-binding SYLF domain-containing protein